MVPESVIIKAIIFSFTILVVAGNFVFALGVIKEKPSSKKMVYISKGEFIMGSTPEEIESGYKLDEDLHKSFAARKYRWFESEKRNKVLIESYFIDILLVTNEDYLNFVKETKHRYPFVNEATWKGYNLIHPYKTVRRFLWKDSYYPKGREEHPVVLVDKGDGEAYCKWRGEKEGRKLRLPTEEEWEKAARGTEGRIFPWGDTFIPAYLNSYDSGPYDTVPVGSYPDGKSPYGLLDMAGQVFEWTSTPGKTKGRYIVKGGSWDDFPGVVRSAAHHERPKDIKHVLIGFRCAGDP